MIQPILSLHQGPLSQRVRIVHCSHWTSYCLAFQSIGLGWTEWIELTAKCDAPHAGYADQRSLHSVSQNGGEDFSILSRTSSDLYGRQYNICSYLGIYEINDNV
jgi:hypothetical protein